MTKTIFDDVKNLKFKTFEDSRGYFSEIYNKENLINNGIEDHFVQDNESFSLKKYTLRGLHFQITPFAQSKLVRVIKGSIMDVYVDLRKNSKNYMSYGSTELNQDSGYLYIPTGFAHGFVTLEKETLVSYKVNKYYNKDAELGIKWNDPSFAIDWSINYSKIILSEKDSNLPLWQEIEGQVDF